MLLALVLTLFTAGTQPPDYSALYAQGVTFEAFMEKVNARQETWRENVSTGMVSTDIAARARSLSRTWRIVAIAEDRCSDSAASLPYVAKLAATAPDKLSLRIVDSKIGRAAMETHRTPDGRAATPTLIFIRDDGKTRAWIERPATLVAMIAEGKKDPKFDVLAAKTKWYAADAGKSTLADIVALLER